MNRLVGATAVAAVVVGAVAITAVVSTRAADDTNADVPNPESAMTEFAPEDAQVLVCESEQRSVTTVDYFGGAADSKALPSTSDEAAAMLLESEYFRVRGLGTLRLGEAVAETDGTTRYLVLSEDRAVALMRFDEPQPGAFFPSSIEVCS